MGTTTQPAPIGAALDKVMERAGISPESLPRGTKFPDIWAALSEEFDANEVKELALKGRKMRYVTARTVMNRLDKVLGPENWSDKYTMISDSSFLCELTIRLPDSQELTKSDVGGMAGMADAGDDDKSGACLPLSAEALTPSGWREYHQLAIGETILAYDAVERICKWTPVRHITVFEEPYPVVQLMSKSFHMVCTRNHRWVVNRRDKGIFIKETKDLDTRDKIINAAPAVGGDHPLTLREAAILGWLATDGCVARTSRKSEGREDKNFAVTIHQSKEPYRSNIRELLGEDAKEYIHPPGERRFPGHAVASLTRERSIFRLQNGFARGLLAKAGIGEWSDMIGLVTRLSVEARTAMFQAMLDGDGQHSSNQLIFGKKAKPGVMEAFEILATLQGVGLGTCRFSTKGDVPLRTLRKLRHVHAKGIQSSPMQPIPVWCPTTELGTWVTRWNGTITITGNSDAFKRAAVKFGVGRYLYRDGVTKYARPNNKTGHGKDQYASPDQVEEYRKATIEFCAAKNSAWADEWADHRGQIPDGVKDILHPIQMTNHLLKWGLLTGRLAEVPMTFDQETGKPTEKVSSEQAKKYVAIIYARDREALAEEAEAYAHQQAAEVRKKWREDNEEVYSTEGGREG